MFPMTSMYGQEDKQVLRRKEKITPTSVQEAHKALPQWRKQSILSYESITEKMPDNSWVIGNCSASPLFQKWEEKKKTR